MLFLSQTITAIWIVLLESVAIEVCPWVSLEVADLALHVLRLNNSAFFH